LSEEYRSWNSSLWSFVLLLGNWKIKNPSARNWRCNCHLQNCCPRSRRIKVSPSRPQALFWITRWTNPHEWHPFFHFGSSARRCDIFNKAEEKKSKLKLHVFVCICSRPVRLTVTHTHTCWIWITPTHITYIY
jgi:hypothetical protein